MSAKKLVVVTGATGSQGNSVAKFLLGNGTYAVRIVTRDPNQAKAQDLAARGAEVVTADHEDLASLKKAFTGAYGVFGVTNYWVKGVGFDGEVRQGKMLVDAAKATGVKHFVWSTLDSTPHKARHWESKAQVDDYLKQSGVGRTSLYTSFFAENYLHSSSMHFKKRDDGSYVYPLPLITDARFAVYSVAETGAFVLAAFLHPELWINKDMRVATDFLSARETAKIMHEITGKTVHVQEIDKKAFDESKGKGLSEEFWANFAAFFDHPNPPFRDPALALKLYPAMKTFPEWVLENNEKLFPE